MFANVQVFTTVEIKPEMTGHYLGELAISYIPTRHGKGSLGKDAYVLALRNVITTGAASFLCTNCVLQRLLLMHTENSLCSCWHISF